MGSEENSEGRRDNTSGAQRPGKAPKENQPFDVARSPATGQAGGGRASYHVYQGATAGARPKRRRRRRVLVASVTAVVLLAAGAPLFVYLAVAKPGGSAASPSSAGQASPPASPSRRPSPTGPASPSQTPGVALLPPSARDEPVPILMYHVLAVPPAGAAYPELFVPPTSFDQQVSWLHAHGYHSVTLTQLFDYWDGSGSLPVKPVVFTFDDGYGEDWTVAGRVLAKYGYVGVLNLKVLNIVPRGGLTARQVRSLIAMGWELAAHTIHHYDLTTLGPAQLQEEVAGSRRELQQQFHVPVDFFCYPSGRFNATVVAAVKAAGFRGATTTIEGLAKRGNPYELPRIRVNGSESLSTFVKTLLAG
jgi:peptidoglycan/xylan/chitin deacetylase (PgdA/CDA1 family)